MRKSDKSTKRTITRRVALTGIALATGAVVAPFVVGARSTALNYEFAGPASDRNLDLKPPVSCTPNTAAQSEGPFYTPQTPRRSVLREPDTGGEPLVLEGLVLTPDCQPIAGAVIDIWHCDEFGRYDNSGFRYRGHQFTDSAGAFRFETIRPAHYTGRTPHIHVKVKGRKTRLLTTQLYFPDLSDSNSQDWIQRDDLLMQLSRNGGTWYGHFNFILKSG